MTGKDFCRLLVSFGTVKDAFRTRLLPGSIIRWASFEIRRVVNGIARSIIEETSCMIIDALCTQALCNIANNIATAIRDQFCILRLSENGNLRAHYTKTTIRAGEILRLVAVFQDTRRYNSVSFGISGGYPEKDQYAQCIDLHGREVFASLSTRGEFYAICQNGSIDTGSDAVLYKVHHLVKRQLPLRVSCFCEAYIISFNNQR